MKTVGDILKEFRIKSGLSQGEFAELLGISPSYLSLLEKGKRNLKLSLLIELKKNHREIYRKFMAILMEEIQKQNVHNFLKGDMKAFAELLKEELHPGEGKRAHAVFRTPFNVPVTLEKHLQKTINKFVEFVKLYSQLEIVFSESITPPDISIPFTLIRFYERDKRLGIEEMARFVRTRLNLGMGPLSNLQALLEISGIKVFTFPVDDNQFSGCAINVSDIGIGILYNWNEIPSRKPFTLAHELGHLVLPSGEELSIDTGIYEETSDTKTPESMVNYFASAFLMPESTYRYYWFNIVGKTPSRMHINMLKDIFNVSYSAALFRAVHIGLIDFEMYHRLKLERTGKYYRQGKFKLKEALPQRFVYLLLRALAEGVIKKEHVRKRLGITKKQLEEIISE